MPARLVLPLPRRVRRGGRDDRPVSRPAGHDHGQHRQGGGGLDLDDLFLFETKRRVQRDRTVSLNGTVFEVDATLVGRTVTLRFDPAAPTSRGVEVWHQDKFVARALPLDAYANCFVRRNRPSRTLETDTKAPAPRPSGLSLRALKSRPSDQESH